MDKLLSIREASRILGVSNGILRRWEKESRLVPERTAGGQRRYPLSTFSNFRSQL
ncbi:MerR family DNA-binding transcriptional regulator [Candidatus Bealeia paramacronuclearis]|uniref:MerR family DNA-binding transcriptional regulator n=1 Tax=Candidatus Bealeia paramacronuclearis TaxID=1921001 RepID=UPI002F25F86F